MGDKISMDEAARRLGIERITVRRLISSGKLPAYRVGGDGAARSVRIDVDDLDKVLHPVVPHAAEHVVTGKGKAVK